MFAKTLVALTLLLWLMPSATIQAEMRAKTKLRAGIPPVDIIKDVLIANDQWTGKQSRTAPALCWLADSDPRINRNLVARAATPVYSIRNLANQLISNSSDLDYAINHLHIPLLLITGNSDSSSIRMFNRNDPAVPTNIRASLDHLHQPLTRAAAITLDKESPDEKELRLVEKNVDYQVEEALKRYRARVKKGRLMVVGGVIDLNNQYGRGENQLIIININGITTDNKLKKMAMVRQLPPALGRHVGRKKN